MENEYLTIKYLNEQVKILRYIGESNHQFNKRLNYIKMAEEKNIPAKEAIRLSKIWFCIVYKKCKYSHHISLMTMNVSK